MDRSIRLRLSAMMFLQYFIWGAWGVVIFTFLASVPNAGGLDFPGELLGWIDATLAIGAMISPLFLGLFADRLFATEKLLAILHLAGAALLWWAASHCAHSVPEVRAAFASGVADEPGLAEAIDRANKLKDERRSLGPDSARAEAIDAELARLESVIQPGVDRVNQSAGVRAAVGGAYKPLFWIMLAYALCYMPTLTLTNSLSFRNLSDPDRYFGSVRVLGTIGWIVAGWVVGLALNEVSEQPLYLAAGASLLLGLFCFALPHTPSSGGAKTLGDALGLPAFAMVKETSFLVFVICSLLISVVLKFYYQQGNPFLTALHAPYPAALQTLGQISEIFFMLLIPVGLRWWGTKGMLVAGMLAWCLRYAVFATQNVPAIVAIGLPLHGICYDFFFVVSYLYVDRKAPPHLRASAQGMITFVTLGVGMFVGSLFTGMVFQQFTAGGITRWMPLWLVPLAGSAIATLLFAVLFREPKAIPGPVPITKALEGLEPAEPPEQLH